MPHPAVHDINEQQVTELVSIPSLGATWPQSTCVLASKEENEHNGPHPFPSLDLIAPISTKWTRLNIRMFLST